MCHESEKYFNNTTDMYQNCTVVFLKNENK